MKTWVLPLLASANAALAAQTAPLIVNVSGRESQSLNGSWQVIVDPYEDGYCRC